MNNLIRVGRLFSYLRHNTDGEMSAFFSFLDLYYQICAVALCTHPCILSSLHVILHLLFEKKICNWPHGFMSSVTHKNSFQKLDDLFQGPAIFSFVFSVQC